MCIDCEIKLFRSLQSILEIYNLCISLLLLQVKFNLDEKFSLIVKVIKSIKKTTDFICQQLNNEKQEIDIIVDDNAKAFVEHKYLNEVT